MHQISKSCALVPSCLSNWRREGDISVGGAALLKTAQYPVHTVQCTAHSTLHSALLHSSTVHYTPVTQSEPFQSFSSWKTLQQLIVVFRSFNVSNVYFCVFLSILLLHILVLVDYSDFNNEHLICSACHWEMFVAGFFCSAEMH